MKQPLRILPLLFLVSLGLLANTQTFQYRFFDAPFKVEDGHFRASCSGDLYEFVSGEYAQSDVRYLGSVDLEDGLVESVRSKAKQTACFTQSTGQIVDCDTVSLHGEGNFCYLFEVADFRSHGQVVGDVMWNGMAWLGGTVAKYKKSAATATAIAAGALGTWWKTGGIKPIMDAAKGIHGACTRLPKYVGDQTGPRPRGSGSTGGSASPDKQIRARGGSDTSPASSPKGGVGGGDVSPVDAREGANDGSSPAAGPTTASWFFDELKDRAAIAAGLVVPNPDSAEEALRVEIKRREDGSHVERRTKARRPKTRRVTTPPMTGITEGSTGSESEESEVEEDAEDSAADEEGVDRAAFVPSDEMGTRVGLYVLAAGDQDPGDAISDSDTGSVSEEGDGEEAVGAIRDTVDAAGRLVEAVRADAASAVTQIQAIYRGHASRRQTSEGAFDTAVASSPESSASARGVSPSRSMPDLRYPPKKGEGVDGTDSE